MKDKINEFLRITKELNKIHIFPVMYGSLGLYFLLNKNGKDIMDIDIVVPRIFTDSKLVKIVEVMSKFGYKQDKLDYDKLSIKEAGIDIGINNIISLTTGSKRQMEAIKVFSVCGLRR
jgi:hypothetical protein